MPAKKKETTFEQLMKARETEEKKRKLYFKADQRTQKLLENFPECHNKLYKHNGVEYVVSKRDAYTAWSSPEIDIDVLHR